MTVWMLVTVERGDTESAETEYYTTPERAKDDARYMSMGPIEWKPEEKLGHLGYIRGETVDEYKTYVLREVQVLG